MSASDTARQHANATALTIALASGPRAARESRRTASGRMMLDTRAVKADRQDGDGRKMAGSLALIAATPQRRITVNNPIKGPSRLTRNIAGDNRVQTLGGGWAIAKRIIDATRNRLDPGVTRRREVRTGGCSGWQSAASHPIAPRSGNRRNGLSLFSDCLA